MLTPSRMQAVTLVALATFAAACTSNSKHASTSTSTPVASSAAPSSTTPTAGTSSGVASASTAPTSTAPSSAASAIASSAAASAPPVSTPRVIVELARSHRVGKGDIGTIDVDELSVIGLPAAAAVAAALQAPATAALADYTTGVASQEPCAGPACGSGDFQANFTMSRADAVVVSGTWTISTFFPGAAHPTTQLTAVIVDSQSGASIAPSQLFAGSSLKALALATAAATKAKLDAIGCTDEFSDGVAPTADNYVGTAIGRAGLLIGLSQGQVAAEACGTVDLAVPWAAVQSQLSSTGARFAATPPPVATAVIGTGTSSASSATAPRCPTTALNVELGVAKQTASTQYQLPIVFTNVSTQPCFLLGFPGTDFGAAGALPVSLVRTPAKAARINLAPGDQAHAVLTYLTGPDPTCDAGGPWIPSTLTVTPPDDTTSVQIPWPNGSVDDCQAGATHPGSYISPVVAN